MLLKLYRTIFTAREIDRIESQYLSRGEAFFHLSGAGHEATAALNFFLIEEDYLLPHYRDKGLMLARGITPQMFFTSLFCKDASHSRGRQMNVFMSSRELNIVSMSGPVGNNALHAVGVAAQIKAHASNPIVLCSLGDGATQQGEVLEAIAEASRRQYPVLFLIEDNQYAISTKTTGNNFYNLPRGDIDAFYGIEILHCDGRNVSCCYDTFGLLTKKMRETRQPIIVHLSVERLSSHTSADDHTIYRSAEEIAEIQRTGDPVSNLKKQLIFNNLIETDVIDQIEYEIREDLAASAKKAYYGADPEPVSHAKITLPIELTSTDNEYFGDMSQPRLTMLEAIREVLWHRLETDERVYLFGQNIEDPKGDIFGMTKGLSTTFPGRVVNSPLSESTIIGTSIGRALAGGKPVALMPFADFLPLAFNQIFSELGSMFWRTDGAWKCPVILLVPCGGYRPGLGPFHAQTFESTVTHVPGIDVMMPSTAADAAGLLNAAFESDWPTIIFYPKSSLNLPDPIHTTSADVSKQFIPPGKARLVSFGDDITFIGYGNTVELCRRAANSLAKVDIEADIIDLRSLSPWDKNLVVKSVRKTKRLIVVHEDNQTCGLGAEIITTINEIVSEPVRCRRIARPDVYIPCHFGNQLEILPSFKRVLTEAANILGFDVSWEQPDELRYDMFNVYAIGTSPSDETVIIVEWYIKKGEKVIEGQPIAAIEATKTAFDLESPVSGIVCSIGVDAEQIIEVGTKIATIRLTGEKIPTAKPVNKEMPGIPLIKKRKNSQITTTNSDLSKAKRDNKKYELPITNLISAYKFDLGRWKEDHNGETPTVRELVSTLESGMTIVPMAMEHFNDAFEIWKSQQAFTFRSNRDEVKSFGSYEHEIKSLMLNVCPPYGCWVTLLQGVKYINYSRNSSYNLIGWALAQPITNNPITRKKMCEISLYVIDPTAIWTPSKILMKSVLKKLGEGGVEFVYGHTSPKNTESIALLEGIGFVNYGRIPKNLHTGVLQPGFRIWGYSMPNAIE